MGRPAMAHREENDTDRTWWAAPHLRPPPPPSCTETSAATSPCFLTDFFHKLTDSSSWLTGRPAEIGELVGSGPDAVVVNLRVVPVGSGFFVNGDAAASVAARCPQCGSSFSSEVSSSFETWCALCRSHQGPITHISCRGRNTPL